MFVIIGIVMAIGGIVGGYLMERISLIVQYLDRPVNTAAEKAESAAEPAKAPEKHE